MLSYMLFSFFIYLMQQFTRTPRFSLVLAVLELPDSSVEHLDDRMVRAVQRAEDT